MKLPLCRSCTTRVICEQAFKWGRGTIDQKWRRHILVYRRENGLFRVISVLEFVNTLLQEPGGGGDARSANAEIR